jgi:hypothetical protein
LYKFVDADGPDRDTLQETWLVYYYDDIHVGTIAVRSGIRHDQPQWGWRRVFYPGCRHCVSFEAARAALEGRLARVPGEPD